MEHPDRGGHALEEQEIEAHFRNSGLGLERPDFLLTYSSRICAVVECKNSLAQLDQAIQEACDYSDTINNHGLYPSHLAIGIAGEDAHGFGVKVRFRHNGVWHPLTSNGYELTAVPTLREIELADAAGDATTTIQPPSISEFIDAAVLISEILRSARVEAPLRPRVIGALAICLYHVDLPSTSDCTLDLINSGVQDAIEGSPGLSDEKKERLIESLKLLGGDYDRLEPFLGRVVDVLKRLNIRPVLQTDTDFLGIFYEAFLRYGYDNNALGIVFTPRHITRFCADLVGVAPNDKVIDLASGTGGFLVAAFDRMLSGARSNAEVTRVKDSIYGYDTNPTIWALSTLNMFFRGDGKSHLENKSCFDADVITNTTGMFTRAFLNPPFSQDDEPERNFIDRSMSCLEPGGLLCVVVKAGIFCDEDNAAWRSNFTREHTVVAVISLPDDLFYPHAAAPTSILVARAHIPHSAAGGVSPQVFMGRVVNDGYSKLKKRRVEIPGSQLPDFLESFRSFSRHAGCTCSNTESVEGSQLLQGNEWAPENWLSQPVLATQIVDRSLAEVKASILRASIAYQGLNDVVIGGYPVGLHAKPPLPYNVENRLDYFYDISGGRSSGEKNYEQGPLPYISSGDPLNSIVRLVEADDDNQVFASGALTVTAFGLCCVQPWPFLARGNGGSAVRVLLPKYRMSFAELVWFAAQINMQRWRFGYARMAIASRIRRLVVRSPMAHLATAGNIGDEIDELVTVFDRASTLL
jgi:type I restriction enzyme M protein